MPVCARCGQDNPAIAKFCLACGAPLTAPAPDIEERKLITVLFTDIVGSTAKAEQMDPEDVRARLAPYYVRLRSELERFGGTVEKFIGDAVVALFGAPVAHEDDPERAVRAAFAVCHAIEELNEQDEWLDLQVRVGVNTGEALIVVGAKSSEGEGMASGDVMNTAARLQSAAPIDGIVGKLTYHATREVIDYSEAEPISAKGKSEPVKVWQAVAIRDQPALPHAADGPLVGRQDEVEAVLGLWRRVQAERVPGHVTVLGAPGLGKTRLLAEIATRVAEEADVYSGRCLPYGEGITYWPVIEILKGAAGILQSEGREAMAAKLGALLDGLPTNDPDELRTMAAAVSNVMGVPTTPQGTYSATDISQAELHWGFRRVLQLLGQQRPLVLVVEDLHWAEPTLLELIRYVLATDDTPIFIVDSGRPELAEAQAEFVVEGERRLILALEPLADSAGEELLTHLLGSAELARVPAAAALLHNAGGNPLFLEETVRMLMDAGVVDESGWRAGDGDDARVPTSLQALIASRLDQLVLAEKQVAQSASVVGTVFWPGAVAHLQESDVEPDLMAHLQTITRRDLVREQEPSSVAGEVEYAFKHILIRDVAYGQLPKGRRAALHVRFSDWVTMVSGAKEDFVEIVAWHLEQACRLSREVARSPIDPPVLAAADALANAADRAERRKGLREARRYYTRALDVLGEAFPEKALELRLRRGIAVAELGELRAACEELVEVDAGAAAAGRFDIRAEALVALADVDQRQGRATEARERLAKADAIAGEIEDKCLRIKAAFILSALRADLEGEFESAVDQLRGAVSIAEEVDALALRVEGHLRIGFLLYNMGDLVGAEEELLRCTNLARELGNHRDEARATFQLSLVKHYRGEPDEGERLALQAREWLERTGDSYMQVQNAHALARFALARDEPEVAEERLRDRLETALEIGGWLAVDTYRLLTEALVRQDRVDDAQELVAFAARSVPEEDAFARASLLLAEAAVATAARESTAAATSFAEALRLIEELNMRVELAEARLALARSLRAFGDLTGAQTELTRARALFSRMEASTAVDLIDRELAELAQESS